MELLQDFTEDQIDRLVDKIGGPEHVARVLSGELDIALFATEQARGDNIRVVADVAYEDRIARGEYGWRHGGLTEQHYPVTDDQIGDWEIKRYHFARSISSLDAIRLIRADGYAPAETGHILAFGECYPTEQRRHPVIGLGSADLVEGSLSVPALWFDGDRRTLDLIWYDGDWHRNYRFLGVRHATVKQP